MLIIWWLLACALSFAGLGRLCKILNLGVRNTCIIAAVAGWLYGVWTIIGGEVSEMHPGWTCGLFAVLFSGAGYMGDSEIERS